MATLILLGNPLAASILVVAWIWGEVMRLRKLRTRPAARQGASELGEDREVGVQPDPLDASDPQRQ